MGETHDATTAALQLERAGMAEALIHAAGTLSGMSPTEFAARRPQLRQAIEALVEGMKSADG